MTSNMISYIHFLFTVSQFNPNFIDKYFINIINQVFNRFLKKSRLNNPPMKLSFETDIFGSTYLISNKSSHKHFLTEFDEKKLIMHIFYDLKD